MRMPPVWELTRRDADILVDKAGDIVERLFCSKHRHFVILRITTPALARRPPELVDIFMYGTFIEALRRVCQFGPSRQTNEIWC